MKDQTFALAFLSGATSQLEAPKVFDALSRA